MRITALDRSAKCFTLLSTKLFALFLHSILLSMSDFLITYISVISTRCFHNFFDTTVVLPPEQHLLTFWRHPIIILVRS
jgi:hypothetical protein